MTEAAGGSRRSTLNAGRLDALVAAHWGPAERRRHAFGSGAALTGELDGEAAVWALVEERPERALGPALLWAERQGAHRLHLVLPAESVDTAAGGVLARQAGLFAEPRPGVWRAEGRSLVAAEPAAPGGSHRPAVRPAAEAVPPELVDLLIDAELEIVVEGGMVRGELNGLEVARIVTGRTTAGAPIDAPLLEVGVGKADRELTGMLHGGLAPVEQLARVVEIVRGHRWPGAEPHPLNQLVPERWLRAVLCRHPDRLGLASLRPAEGAHSRTNLRDRDIAVALGATVDGEPAVVACAVGAALELVPLAADARRAVAPDARLVLAVPERDDLAGNRRLAGRLRASAAVAPLSGDWRA
jgi:hypothetical protein